MTLNVMAQSGSTDAKKDSLRKIIPTLEWKDRINAYEQLVDIYFNANKDQQTMDSLLVVLHEVDQDAQKNNDTVIQCANRTKILVAYLNINMYDKVIELAPEFLSFIEKNEAWRFYYASSYRYLFEALLNKGETEKAMQTAQNIYDHANARNNIEGLAAANFMMSIAYEKTARMVEAESYVRKSIDLIKDIEKPPLTLSSYYFSLCGILRVQGRYDEALQMTHEYERFIIKMEQYSTLPSSYWINVWKQYSSIYESLRDYGKAEEYLDKIDNLNIGNPVVIRDSYRSRARMFERNKQYEKALEFAEKAYEMPPYLDFTTGNALWIKASILSRMGRVDEAQKCLMEMIDLNDSIRNVDFAKQIDELRVIHEVESITTEKELGQKQLVYSLAGCCLLFVALSIWVIYSRRLQNKNINLVKQIQKKDMMYDEMKADQTELKQLRRLIYQDIDEPEANKEQNDLFNRLNNYMNEEQPYTNPELNRKAIAEALNTNEKYLRNAILKNAGITVNEYIMQYRLKHANKLLRLPAKEYTIEAVAIDSGFGSRNLFYKYYRDNFGLTPTEYRKIARTIGNNTP